MNKWHLIIDIDRCNNCNNCTMATKDEYVGNDFPGYAAAQPDAGHEWITIDRHIRGSGAMVDVAYVPRTCNHCDNAPCVAAGRGAVTQRPDGIVIIDPVKAKGRKDLVDSCPYGAIWWNEAAQLPQQWIFDAHLLDAGWKEPRCAQACPSGALTALKTSDAEMQAMAKAQHLEVLRPELQTGARVYYRGLARTRDCFLGGNVSAAGAPGEVDNVEGALVELSLDGSAVIQARTDCFGDFKIDGLRGGGRAYRLHVRHPTLGEARAEGVLQTSDYIGTLALTA